MCLAYDLGIIYGNGSLCQFGMLYTFLPGSFSCALAAMVADGELVACASVYILHLKEFAKTTTLPVYTTQDYICHNGVCI